MKFQNRARLRVDHAYAGRSPRAPVKANAVHNAIWPERHASRLFCRGQGGVYAAEVRPRDASSFTRTAVVASRPIAMILGKNGHTPYCQDALPPEMFRNRIPDCHLCAVKLHGRKEFTVGQLRKSQRLAADSDEIFHVVVPWRYICVADRPINCNSLAKVRFEIQVAPSVNLAAPHYGAPTHLPSSDPPERLARLGRVGMLFVAYKKLCRPFIAGVAGALNLLVVQ